MLHAARGKYRRQKITKKSLSGHHRTTLSGYVFATKAHIDNRRKNFKQPISPPGSTCPHNMVNFGPLAAEIGSLVCGTPANRVSCLGSVTARHSSSGRQPNFAALKEGRHLYSAGRPSYLGHWPTFYFVYCLQNNDF